MRILAISRRVLKELCRDKRTLALMFIAPLLVLTLMNIAFTTNQTTSIKIAAVNVSKVDFEILKNTKNVSIKNYDSESKAQTALDERKVDAVVVYEDEDSTFVTTYANTDSGKTALTKAAIKGTIVQHTIQTLKAQLAQIATVNQSAGANQLQNPVQTLKNKYVYGDSKTNFMDQLLPILMGFFVFFFIFLISGMALLKERTSGTLDRLLATPVKRSDIVFGYMLSYGLLAILQTLVIVLFTVTVLGVEVVGSLALVVLTNVLLALVALALGILLSTFAKSEFQMMQFIPLIVVPQVFFSGIIPLDNMDPWLKNVSYLFPLSYVGNAMTDVVMYGQGLKAILPNLGVLLLFLLILTILNIMGLKRYRKV